MTFSSLLAFRYFICGTERISTATLLGIIYCENNKSKQYNNIHIWNTLFYLLTIDENNNKNNNRHHI